MYIKTIGNSLCNTETKTRTTTTTATTTNTGIYNLLYTHKVNDKLINNVNDKANDIHIYSYR